MSAFCILSFLYFSCLFFLFPFPEFSLQFSLFLFSFLSSILCFSCLCFSFSFLYFSCHSCFSFLYFPQCFGSGSGFSRIGSGFLADPVPDSEKRLIRIREKTESETLNFFPVILAFLSCIFPVILAFLSCTFPVILAFLSCLFPSFFHFLSGCYFSFCYFFNFLLPLISYSFCV